MTGIIHNPNLDGKSRYILPFSENPRHKLDVIENFFPPHPSVKESILSAVESGVHSYPYPDENFRDLTDKVANYVGVKSNRIIFTNGSDNALKLIIEAFVLPESKVIVPQPTYPHFMSFLSVTYNSGIFTPTVVFPEQLLSLDYTLYGVCYLTSPNLPFGYCIPNDIIRKITEKNPNVMFVVDEAYHEYGNPESAAEISAENLIVVRTFSKAFGLAALRLGFLIASENMIKIISPLVNDKNVTKIAVAAGNAVMDNKQYYQDYANVVENEIKPFLREKLRKITSSTSRATRKRPIYSYNIAAGNFFLIYAVDTKFVVDVFARHLIFIRDKHSDIPNAIRITISNMAVMRECLSVIELINLKYLISSSTGVVYDLDMTLRDGCKSSAKMYPGAQCLIINPNSWIFTNNNITPMEVSQYFSGLILPDRIVTGLSVVKNLIEKNNLKPLIVGNYDHLKYFDESSYPVEYDSVVLVSVDISMSKIIEVCHVLSKKCTLFYPDPSEKCTLNECSEFSGDPEVVIPDMGSIIKLFSAAGYSTQLIGKPNVMIPDEIEYVVGDSDTDRQLAKNNDVKFIYVNPAVSAPKYDFDRNEYVIPCVSFLE